VLLGGENLSEAFAMDVTVASNTGVQQQTSALDGAYVGLSTQLACAASGWEEQTMRINMLRSAAYKPCDR